MSEPTIVCPNCATEIKLTDSLAAPLIQATRQKYEEKLLAQNKRIGEREEKIKEKQAEIADARKLIDEQVAKKNG